MVELGGSLRVALSIAFLVTLLEVAHQLVGDLQAGFSLAALRLEGPMILASALIAPAAAVFGPPTLHLAWRILAAVLAVTLFRAVWFPHALPLSPPLATGLGFVEGALPILTAMSLVAWMRRSAPPQTD